MGCSRKRRLYVAQGEEEKEEEEEEEERWEGEEGTLTGDAVVVVVLLLLLVKGRRRGLAESEMVVGEGKARGRARWESVLRILTLFMPLRK